MIFEHKEKHC